jgi:hypothetical protein
VLSHLNRARVLRPVVLATLVTAGLLSALAPSASASAEQDTGGLTPSVDAAAYLFPYLSGGSATTYPSRGVYVKAEDCVSNDTTGKARRGEVTTYTLPDGTEPASAGHDAPGAEVYEFGNARRARAAYRVLSEYAERCQGRHVGERYEVSLRPGRDPRLGDESLAYGLTTRTGDGVHGSTTVRSTWIVLREGSRLVRVDVGSWGTRPTVRETVAWAQLVLHKLR